MADTPLNQIVAKYKEYGQIYKNIKSGDTKEQLLRSAPEEVLNAYALVTKNILIGNISLTMKEHEHLSQYKQSLMKLGLSKCSAKAKRRLLSEGDIFLSLSKIMTKLTTQSAK